MMYHSVIIIIITVVVVNVIVVAAVIIGIIVVAVIIIIGIGIRGFSHAIDDIGTGENVLMMAMILLLVS